MAAGLTTGGWIFLILAWGSIISVTVFCLRRILRAQGREED
jgi:hypothetical protein